MYHARNYTILNAIYQSVIVLQMGNNASLLKSILRLACNAIKSRYHPSGTQRFHDTHL